MQPCLPSLCAAARPAAQVVAALPEHAHLFGEFGCYGGREHGAGRGKGIVHVECGRDEKGVETRLDPAFYPLELTEEQDRDWYEIVRAHTGGPGPGEVSEEKTPPKGGEEVREDRSKRGKSRK